MLTLGDYLDKTPRDLLTKVMLEEIVFDTWYGGRSVLLGDGMCVYVFPYFMDGINGKSPNGSLDNSVCNGIF